MAAKKNANMQRTERDRLRAYRERQAAHQAQSRRRRRDNVLWVIIGGAVVALAVTAQVMFSVIKPYTPSPNPSASSSSAPSGNVPDPALAEGRVWTGMLDINGLPLTVELDGAAAPQAVASTISLANSGFYDQLACHRITTEGIFVLQCGDPNGDGTGGPGYSYGPVENAPAGDFYPAGTIAMARQGGNANSIGSQFFIVYKDSTIPSDAAGGYTVIGRITSGLDALNTEITAKGTRDGTSDGTPSVPTVIGSFTLK